MFQASDQLVNGLPHHSTRRALTVSESLGLIGKILDALYITHRGWSDGSDIFWYILFGLFGICLEFGLNLSLRLEFYSPETQKINQL